MKLNISNDYSSGSNIIFEAQTVDAHPQAFLKTVEIIHVVENTLPPSATVHYVVVSIFVFYSEGAPHGIYHSQINL